MPTAALQAATTAPVPATAAPTESSGPPAAGPAAIVPAPTAAPREPSDGPTLPPQRGLRTNPLRLPQLPMGTVLEGMASWYGPGFNGSPTACGPIYDQNMPVLASRELRCGTIVRVTGPYGVSADAMAIDWGPVEWAGRRFDLSAATFAAIAPLGRGVIPVRLEVIGVAASQPHPPPPQCQGDGALGLALPPPAVGGFVRRCRPRACRTGRHGLIGAWHRPH